MHYPLLLYPRSYLTVFIYDTIIIIICTLQYNLCVGIIVGFDESDKDGKWTITDANNFAETFKRDDFITDHDDGGKTITVREHAHMSHGSQ